MPLCDGAGVAQAPKPLPAAAAPVTQASLSPAAGTPFPRAARLPDGSVGRPPAGGANFCGDAPVAPAVQWALGLGLSRCGGSAPWLAWHPLARMPKRSGGAGGILALCRVCR